ncbi:MAG: putative acetyl xylan esterase, partial [Solirubrobacterales bacterium]|nr:putative acetyl xylan esterase [Solirubrobacterales bacterium]
MREDIEFVSGGVTLRGWFYAPDGAAGEVPCVVMAHGFAAVKEMHLDDYAEVFTAAGLACVVRPSGLRGQRRRRREAAAGDRP